MGKPRGGEKDRKKERYYQAAKRHGYRSRSAYKLRQIAKKHNLLKGVDKVLELCCSPGGWTQVLREIDPGLRIVAVDLSPMPPIQDVKFILGDITNPEIIETIEAAIEGAVDLVLSDCSPNVSGTWSLDAVRQIYLAEHTIELAHRILTKNGKVLTKVFQGQGFQEFLKSTRTKFNSVKLVKPEASRSTSAEIYLMAKGPIRKNIR
ncbi:MAG: 23S rRNA methyltransferase [Candidatus Thorarchaeota archaeon]|nr:23S rRNA methyltransferase [Candidatus Thorarchaeota archaeon]